jgi:hypothetical protein
VGGRKWLNCDDQATGSIRAPDRVWALNFLPKADLSVPAIAGSFPVSP